jgi:isopentenyl diphosphate isomerase/L-lactate dehydrogenase-like FMN-dependent dehydrogenase
LGATAVVIGGACFWGPAANGQVGVENVLDLLHDGFGSAVVGLGRASVADLNREDLIIPPGFERQLGAAAIEKASVTVSPTRRSGEA